MADLKISQLTGATTPLAGTEVLPIVQSSSTKKVSVADLTAGRAISATQMTLTTGNLIVASGQGVDFSATAGTGTSELLDDYEEGVWTPDLTFETPGNLALTYGVVLGTYTKVGRLVTVAFRITTSAFTWTTASGGLQVGGLPFTARTLTNMRTLNPLSFNGITKANYTTLNSQVNSGSSTIVFNMSASGQSQSGVNAADLPSGGAPFLAGIIVYETDS